MGGMSGPHVIRGSVVLPEAELQWRFSRSSGPGGQHVNTSDSQVELRFDLARTEALPEVWKARALERLASRLVGGVLTVRASEHRSQWRNRETAAVKLAALLAEATAPPPKARRATRVPRGINERRLREKKQRARTKQGRSGKDWT
ncbi:alternative ribosome rescue aminoacyl-tRNA hydrolase ArfB [Streptomyces sp. NPDC060194]|uniref:alternative ribosome rescue aminoacyl-tRNA hydrolase ArfB n=1 Tax=Streptomyces sp. NPDC060194 TaxID=3347069 RepID=UPI00364C3339